MLAGIIQNAFGLNCEVNEIKLKGLPVYMLSGRKAYSVSLSGCTFVLIEISEADRFGTVALKKQLSAYSVNTEMNVAFLFWKLTRIQRDALISKEIPFLSPPDQIYLPFLGIILANSFKADKVISTDKMMPATQSLFLYLIYNNRKNPVIKKQASEDLGLTRTSITRASEQLKAMGLITENRVGKETEMIPVSAGRELYDKAKEHLINPVQKVICVQGYDPSDGIVAGESALSIHSMLGRPKADVYAVYKADIEDLSVHEIDPKWQADDGICYIELWKYNPALFSKGNTVDPVSLAMSLSDNDDERVQGELQTYLEEYKW